MSMIPKGGDTIWGGLDWSPEGNCNCNVKKVKNNDTNDVDPYRVNYGRMISFGKDVAETHSSKIERIDFRVSLSLSHSLFMWSHISIIDLYLISAISSPVT